MDHRSCDGSLEVWWLIGGMVAHLKVCGSSEGVEGWLFIRCGGLLKAHQSVEAAVSDRICYFSQ